MRHPENLEVANRLLETASLLEHQGADPFRVRAYRDAAHTVATLGDPVSALLASGGVAALEALPGIGPRIARSIQALLLHGRLPMLERLRGESDPVAVLASVAGIGPVLAARLHDELGIETLEDFEAAAYDGRLASIDGFGPRRIAAVRDVLAHRLSRVRTPLAVPPAPEPSVREILDVDREYRMRSARGELRTIAPRRFNPDHRAWLPILHTQRGEHHYTALFSNTHRAHQLGRTHDWVVIYYDGDHGERQSTVITAEWGALRGRRIVRGREAECEELYRRSGTSSGGGGGTSPGGSGVSGGGTGTMRLGPGTSTG
jgi:hypothetical protein